MLLFLWVSNLASISWVGFLGSFLCLLSAAGLVGGWPNWDGFRWTDLSTWPSPRLHMAAVRRSGNTPDLLRPRLRTDTKSLPPNSVGQSKFQDNFHSRGLEIDPVSWSEELQRGWHGEGKNHCLLYKQTATPSTLLIYCRSMKIVFKTCFYSYFTYWETTIPTTSQLAMHLD